MKAALAILAAAAALATSPEAAVAAASPVPSPSLDQTLATPPAGFQADPQWRLDGRFTAGYYSAGFGRGVAGTLEADLGNDGFVDGYGSAWTQPSSKIELVQFALAFAGGQGARAWFATDEVLAFYELDYQERDTPLTGVDPNFGVHYDDTTNDVITDVYAFVKGNDFYLIGATSKHDDVRQLANTQAMAQYAAAPAQTIPQSDWPENAKGAPIKERLALDSSVTTPLAVAALLILILAGCLVAAIVMLWTLRRRAGTGHLAGVAATGATVSPDGRYWWDGQAWRPLPEGPPPVG